MKIVFTGDGHSGHRVGITSPEYNFQTNDIYHDIRSELYNYYKETIESLKPIDLLVHNGDAIDGKGNRSGGTELILPDPHEQINCIYSCLKIADAKDYVFTYGTTYHTGSDTDYEKQLADKFSASIRSHQWLEINGLIFDVKHHIGNSGIPHGKGTPISKDWLWNQIWALHDEQPKADIIIRSHVHNFFYCGGCDWLGMTLPALQGQGSKFGARRCSQEVHFGLVWFDINDDGSFTWNRKILRAASQKQIPLRF